jgi:hypothetical protein
MPHSENDAAATGYRVLSAKVDTRAAVSLG